MDTKTGGFLLTVCHLSWPLSSAQELQGKNVRQQPLFALPAQNLLGSQIDDCYRPKKTKQKPSPSPPTPPPEAAGGAEVHPAEQPTLASPQTPVEHMPCTFSWDLSR